MPYTHVRGHRSRRGRTTFWVDPHSRRTVGSRAKGRTGEKFKRLQHKVAKGYVGKPVPPKYQSEYGKTYSKEEAEQVGKKVAGKRFWSIEGKRRGSKILRRER